MNYVTPRGARRSILSLFLSVLTVILLILIVPVILLVVVLLILLLVLVLLVAVLFTRFHGDLSLIENLRPCRID